MVRTEYGAKWRSASADVSETTKDLLPCTDSNDFSMSTPYCTDRTRTPYGDIIIIIIIIIFNLRTAAFRAYCAIWVRHSNFRHQASPRVSPRESTQRRKVELWARNVREFCLNANFHVTFRDLLRHGTDGFTSLPKEGVLEHFFALKIRRLRPGANPRTWVRKASTLPLDHRSRMRIPWAKAY